MYYKIKGFKGLKNTTKLDLAPITILVGKNGSGKSSAISALNQLKDITKIGERFNKNKMESFLNFSLPNRRDFGVDIDGELDYAIPINLSFFDDKFELRLKYGANSDLIYLTRFEIFNVTKNEFLFCLNGENVSKENDLGIEVEALKVSLRINLNYLLNEFKRLKKLYPKPFNLLDFVAKNNLNFSAEFNSEEEIDAIQQTVEHEKSKWKEFIKNLTVGFDDYKGDIKVNKNISRSIDPRGNEFDKFSSTIEDLSLFELEKNNKEIDDDLIDKIKMSIQDGQSFFIPKKDIDTPGISLFLTDLFNKKTDDHTWFSSNKFSDTLERELGYDLSSALDVNIKRTVLFNELIDEMLLDNIHSNTAYLLSNSDFTYIPPNRIGKYSTNSKSSVGFALENLADALKHAGYSDKSSSFFINYWFKKFDISEENFNLDKALKLLEDSINLEKEGYGIQQLIPLIVILSLSSKLHNSEFSSNPDQHFISQYDQLKYENYKKFLIEEPEANLHPSFQSKLADLFLDAWIKYDHEFVIETHSEYLIRKLQYHVGSGKVDPAVINIYYFDKDDGARKININKDGSLSAEFGPGFYDEADNIAIELFMLDNDQLN